MPNCKRFLFQVRHGTGYEPFVRVSKRYRRISFVLVDCRVTLQVTADALDGRLPTVDWTRSYACGDHPAAEARAVDAAW